MTRRFHKLSLCLFLLLTVERELGNFYIYKPIWKNYANKKLFAKLVM